MRSFATILGFIFLLILPECQNATHANSSLSEASNVKDSTLVTHINFPWEILWGPDQFIWMTEREGRISRVNPKTGEVIPLITVPEVVSNGEGGMLGMALHPDFTSTPKLYVAYNYNKDGDYREKVVEFTYNGRTLINPKTLIDNIDASSIHNGCRLLISPDKKLFITTGDASQGQTAQDKKSLNGKILRLNLDGTIPSDNPMPGTPVWSYGHRNPQGLVFANSVLFSSEHGPLTNDEINIITKGRNYGWPVVKGYCTGPKEKRFCLANNVVEPVKAWSPTAAVCGLDYYNEELIPEWKNSLLLVSLKNARLYQLKLEGLHGAITSSTEYFKNKYGRLRDLCISPEGKVYICTSNGGNKDKIIVITQMIPAH